MSNQYLGQISAFAFQQAPKGWALCAGQLLSIMQNQALFALLGTTYGGDGRQTFALPDLRSRTSVGQNSANYPLGVSSGSENVTVLVGQMPQHNHTLNAISNPVAGTSTSMPGNTLIPAQADGVDTGGNPAAYNIYTSGVPATALSPQALVASGANQAHNNMMPYLAVNFCIALTGIFPSRN